MKPPFRLVPDQVSKDTIEALQQMLGQAKKGELIGIAFAAMYRHREYIVNTTGEAHRNPTFARGMVAALDDELSNMGTPR